MKILFDINVVLDVLLARARWAPDSALLLDAAERKKVTGCVAGHTITTAHYVIARAAGARKAATAVTDMLRILEVVPIEAADFAQALVLGMSDFEDAVQAAAAAKVGADYIATRNEKDFRRGPVAARSPAELLALL
ncbi:MAG: PIN domain-containing protein [Gemmatimonadaceae bacterium]|nr:PIN domain-containing protein [Gemmatimonadaceae bacterium]